MILPREKANREKVSSVKKKMIFERSLELFQTYGYDNTTIADISKATGMSVGSIYHYYKNKEAILLELRDVIGQSGNLMDRVEEKVQDPCEPIITYLCGLSADFENLGMQLVKRLLYRNYEGFIPLDKAFISMEYLKTLTRFIQLAQEAGTVDASLSAQEIAFYLISVSRGLLLEWLYFDSDYSLTEKARSMLPRIVKTFLL